MSTNIENCEKYIKKQSLLGTETFKFEIKPETDEVLLKKYIENGDEFRAIEIPKFVTGISRKVDSWGFIKDWNTIDAAPIAKAVINIAINFGVLILIA